MTVVSPNIQNIYFQCFRSCDILVVRNITLTQMSLSPWIKSFFSVPQQDNPNIVGATATPQNDGISNELKYFCNIDPSVPMTDAGRAALPAVQTEDLGSAQYLTLTYRKNAWAGGLTSSLQVSTDLSANSWQTVTPDLTQTVSIDSLSGDQTIKAGVNVTGTPGKFIRLRVTGP